MTLRPMGLSTLAGRSATIPNPMALFTLAGSAMTLKPMGLCTPAGSATIPNPMGLFTLAGSVAIRWHETRYFLLSGKQYVIEIVVGGYLVYVVAT